MSPFRLKFIPLPCVSETVLQSNYQKSRGVERIKSGQTGHPLAVCGGGPSLEQSLSVLSDWPGDIWAINWTADYLLSKGIDCTLFTIDPIVKASTAAKRVIASSCDPELFTPLTKTFDVCEVDPAGITGGPTSACRAPSLALRLGYPAVVFFGCDSSFEESDHVDRHEAQKQVLIVRAGGREFKTYPDLLMQAECLSELLSMFPQYFASMSNGLMDAMAVDKDWEVVAVSEAMKQHLIEVNGDSGLYESVYSPQGH